MIIGNIENLQFLYWFNIILKVQGMTELQNFLEGTNGMHLLHFWLDCEEFKDTMEDYDDDINFVKRIQLFR